MKEQIIANIYDPEKLELMYRQNPSSFQKDFGEIYPELPDQQLVEYWKIRLSLEGAFKPKTLFQSRQISALLISCFVSFVLIKIPALFSIDVDSYPFYERNVGLIILFGMSLYQLLSNPGFSRVQYVVSLGLFAIAGTYVNLLPVDPSSHSLNLIYIHLPLFLWSLYGLIYMDFQPKDFAGRITYLKHNGYLAIMGTLLMIAGMIMTGITIGLFEAIQVHIEDFYVDYVVISGVVCAPVVAVFVLQQFPNLISKIAPIIANIFSPLVLLTLVVYLISMFTVGKDPYEDRDFLLVFNIMLIAVMGIIVFSITGGISAGRSRFNEVVLLGLVAVSLLVDLIALSAILYRVAEYGFTPNRAAVLGSNLLFFCHLSLILLDLVKVNRNKMRIDKVDDTIARYLPFHVLWTILVIVGFPIMFGLS
ncbi:MAG: DUF4153 domain-containing protein [Bacteroidota bacterium]